MPLIKVQTSVSAPAKAEVEGMLKSLSAKLAKHLGKPESYEPIPLIQKCVNLLPV